MFDTIDCAYCGRPKDCSQPCQHCNDQGAVVAKPLSQRLRELASRWENIAETAGATEGMFGAAATAVTARTCARQLREVLDD
jgi:uncharacterized protein YcaQ